MRKVMVTLFVLSSCALGLLILFPATPANVAYACPSGWENYQGTCFPPAGPPVCAQPNGCGYSGSSFSQIVGGVGIAVGLASFAIARSGGQVSSITDTDEVNLSGVDVDRPKMLGTRTRAPHSSQASPQIPCSGLKAQVNQVADQLRINASMIHQNAANLQRQASQAKMGVELDAVLAIAGTAAEGAVVDGVLDGIGSLFRGAETFDFAKSAEVAKQTCGKFEQAKQGMDLAKTTSETAGAYSQCRQVAASLSDYLRTQQDMLSRLHGLVQSYVRCLQANPGAKELIQREDKTQRTIERNRSSQDFTVSAPGSPIDNP